MADRAGVGHPVTAEREVLVRSMTWEADRVLSVVLADPNGEDLPPWEPGAHIDLLIPGGLPRQYSLCSDPADRSTWRIGVLHEEHSRGGSEWVHTRLRPGELVIVGGPRNSFTLSRHQRYLFIAGGIGITPLLPMITTVAARGADWRLVHGGRASRTMPYSADLDPARVTRWPQDTHGLLPLEELLGTPLVDTGVYCCGPEPLLAAVEELCRRWPPGALRVERFAPRTPAPDRRVADTFDVELASSGLVVTVDEGTSILAALEARGIVPDSSCQEGTCGTCETRVLSGRPEHRDSILDEDDRTSGDTMMICVSRSLTPRLVLDL